MSKNTGDGELDEIFADYGEVRYPNENDFNRMKTAIKKWSAQEANKAQQQLLQGLMEELPSGEVDLIKFERDKTGWIEEVGVDPETLTDKDMIAVWQLARHFKQQAIKELKVIQNKLEGLS